MFSGGTVALDPEMNRPYVITKDDGAPGAFEFRPFAPPS